MGKRFQRAALLVLFLACGCMRTGNIGKPIGERYQAQLDKVVIGETTPKQLNSIFEGRRISKIESMASDDETWRLLRSGDGNAGLFLLTGAVARDKDQVIYFHFNNGVLSGYESAVLPDYDEKKVAKGKTTVE
jgi:hypothetical protein